MDDMIGTDKIAERDAAEATIVHPTCGIIMPIAAMGKYAEKHWGEVLSIVEDAVREAKLVPNLVSNASSVGVIQKRIVDNLYQNPIVVCDVSGKNPNVMLELGMRLAFDKPVVIIQDDDSGFSFDTAPIEHIIYPISLHYHMIKDFKRALVDKLNGTLEASKNPGYTTFLGHFGSFITTALDVKEGSTDEIMIEKLKNLEELVQRIVPIQANKEVNNGFPPNYLELYKAYKRQGRDLKVTDFVMDEIQRQFRENKLEGIEERKHMISNQIARVIDLPLYYDSFSEFDADFNPAFDKYLWQMRAHNGVPTTPQSSQNKDVNIPVV